MRKTALAILWVTISAGIVLAGTLQSDLVTKLNESSDDELIRIMITMEVQGDHDWMISATRGLSKLESRELVMAYLKDIAESTQPEVRSYLEAHEIAGKVKDLQSVWIVNALHGLATPEVIRGLEGFPGVGQVSYDPEQYLLFHQKAQKQAPGQIDGTDEIAWGVLDVHADDVWAMGYDGTGIIVSVLDTGVNYNHNDLLDHMWDGGPEYPNHGWDFYNNDDDPMDDGTSFLGGHGTHVAGSVASDGTAGSQCGVAPDASIMAVKVLSGNGYGSEGPVISGINFAVEQGADIFSMSLGWQSTSQRYQFRAACDNALAAGVIASIAAGNEGNSQYLYPIPGNVRTPGDVPPPWLHPDQTLSGGTSCVVTVGATNSSHTIANFSSVGPSTWENVSPWFDYAYSGGSQMGLIDPDVSAPGVSIKSLDFQNVWGYADGWSGTSMATPHVAGTMALMLDKNPDLAPAEIDMYLETTALGLGAAGKDNIYGSGLINAAAAVSAVPDPGTVPDVTVTLTPTGSTALPSSGGSLSFDADLVNNEASTTFVTGWLEWTYPNGTSSGALVLRNLSMAAGGSIVRFITLTVSGSEPDGNYTLWGRLGSSYGGTIYAEDSFPFTKGLDNSGSGEWVEETRVYGWDEEEIVLGAVPDAYELGQSYPNPFNPVTTIPFSVAHNGRVSLKAFDLQGREVAAILVGELAAGYYEVTYDASHLSAGVYFYRLEAGDFSRTMKFALVK